MHDKHIHSYKTFPPEHGNALVALPFKAADIDSVSNTDPFSFYLLYLKSLKKQLWIN